MNEYIIDDIAKKDIENFFLKTQIVKEKFPTIIDRFRSSRLNFLRLNGLNNFSKYPQTKLDEYNFIWAKKNVIKNFNIDELSGDNLNLTTYVLDNNKLRKAPQWSLNSLGILIFSSYLRKNSQSVKSVLEIGSGNGLNLIALAVAFPNIRFVGLELTKEGVNQAKKALLAKNAIKNLCKFIFGNSVEYKGQEITNIEFIELDVVELSPSIINPDQIFSFLALEQMESVFEGFLKAFKLMKGSSFFLFEPFLEFNNYKQKEILRRKGYLYRSTKELNKISDESFQSYYLPRKINKMKYAYGIVLGRIA